RRHDETQFPQCSPRCPVWCLRRGHWQAAEIVARGHKACRIKFLDTGKCAQRRYEDLVGLHRQERSGSADRPGNGGSYQLMAKWLMVCQLSEWYRCLVEEV